MNDLLSVEPDLADRLSMFLKEWRSGPSGTSSIGQGNMDDKQLAVADPAMMDRMAKLGNEWDEVIDKVRRIPNFQNFLSPPRRYSHMMEHLPSCGPVVLINVHKDRCDALVLFAARNDPLHVPLHTFAHKQAEELRVSLFDYLSSQGARMPDEVDAVHPTDLEQPITEDNVLQKVLEDLWRGVAKPVLDAIDFERLPPGSSTQRRIWWCPTGPLTSLPIHAAGIYNDPSGSSICVSDFAMSSYIPTVTTLTDMVRDSDASQLQSPTSLLLVGQSEAPNLPPIPHTDKEVEDLAEMMQVAKIKTVRISGKDAMVGRVKEEMEKHSNVHFACHATQDIEHPLKSRFYLHDGQLELSEILKWKISTADMAFLSACKTSAGDIRLSNEAVHLAAGMLMVGYRSIIATMWSISDTHGPDIAKAFYADLLGTKNAEGDAGEPTLDGKRAAYALHHAIQKIRQNPAVGDTAKGLLTWVPYVHFGI